MVKFDSTEYWQANTWDRHVELGRVPRAVKDEFLRQEKQTVSKALALVSGDASFRIMDLACGTGRIAGSILQMASHDVRFSVTLVDFNLKTLEIAKERLHTYRHVSCVLSNVYEIGDAFDGCFDVVICLELFHHISDLQRLFGQVKKVLKPNGVLIGNVFAAESYGEWDKLKYGAVKSFRRRLLSSFAEEIYDKMPSAAKKIIRKYGVARIAPLFREELVSYLGSYFDCFEIATSYYYWFYARKA